MHLIDKKPLALRGFTLIELLVVLAIVSMLLTLAVPRFFSSVDTAKETILVENLRLTRETLDKFYADTGRYPDSLDELVEAQYLKNLPNDPVVDSRTAWKIVPPKAGLNGKVFDLHSSAPGKNRLGQPFEQL
jgi:general secretion pathway protein G